MQSHTPEDHAVLTARRIVVSSGLELLDTDDQVLADISDQLVPAASSITRDNYAAVHGSCDLQLLTTLDWPAVRLRPYQLISADGSSWARWNLGV